MGHFSCCKYCTRQQQRQYELLNKPSIRDRKRRYRERNAKRLQLAARRYYREHRTQIRERRKQYEALTKDRRSERNHAWYIENRERICAQQKEYYRRNREAVCARHRCYSAENAETVRARNKEYRRATIDIWRVDGRIRAAMGQIIGGRSFGFSLLEVPIETVCTLFYSRLDKLFAEGQITKAGVRRRAARFMDSPAEELVKLFKIKLKGRYKPDDLFTHLFTEV